MNDDDLLLCPPTTPLTVAERDRIESTLRDRLRIQTAVERRAAGRRARAAAAFLPALVVTCLGSGLALVLVAVASPSSTPLDRHPVAASGPAVRTLEVAARRVEGAATVAPAPVSSCTCAASPPPTTAVSVTLSSSDPGTRGRSG